MSEREATTHAESRQDNHGGSLARASAGLRSIFAQPLSAEDLDLATAALAAPIESDGGERVSLLVVQCGRERMAFRAEDVARVVAAAPSHRVPHRTNEVFTGIANHEGELLLCIRLERALGLAPVEGQEGEEGAAGAAGRDRSARPLVVIEEGRRLWAVEVDRIFGVEDVESSALRDPPLTLSAAHNGCTECLARIGEADIVVLSATSIGRVAKGALP